MNSEKKQLSLIFVLLAVLVILPTVCMLWFVIRASQNEQFAIKQRLIDKYEAEVKQKIYYGLPEYYQKELDKAIGLYKEQLAAGKDVSCQVFADRGLIFDYVYVYKNRWSKLVKLDYMEEDTPPVFERAEQLEFQQDNFLQAADEYRRVADESREYAAIAISGEIRCLRKAGKLKDAIDLCQMVLTTESMIFEKRPHLYWRTKLLLSEMYAQAGRSELTESITELVQCASELLNYETKVFIFNRAIELIGNNNLEEELAEVLEIMKKEMQFADYLLKIEGDLLNSDSTKSVKYHSPVKLDDDYRIDGKYISFNGFDSGSWGLAVCVLQYEKFISQIKSEIEGVTDDMIFVNLFDQRYHMPMIAGEQVISFDSFRECQEYRDTIFAYEFSNDSSKEPFGGWKLWCAFRPGVFGYVASNYKMIYVWTVVSVLVFAGAAAFIVGRLLLKQARINHLKNDFIATVTHELKTPLTSTRMLIDTLLEGKYEDHNTVEEYLRIISSENTRLNSLIDNFLTFSRMERSKQVFDKQRMDVNELISEAAAMFNKKEEKNVIFSVTKCPQSSLILVDKQAMLTVILNLLSNAWKYTEKETKEIALRAYLENGKACFAVKDNGIGLTIRQQKRVFDRFYRVDDSLARRAEGTGIGLTIVKFIVEAHGGIITVNSKPGIGTEFIVLLNGI